MSTLSNIFSSEATGPILVRFMREHLCLLTDQIFNATRQLSHIEAAPHLCFAGTKVYIFDPGHMTIPTYSENLEKKCSSPGQYVRYNFETWHTAKGLYTNFVYIMNLG